MKSRSRHIAPVFAAVSFVALFFCVALVGLAAVVGCGGGEKKTGQPSGSDIAADLDDGEDSIVVGDRDRQKARPQVPTLDDDDGDDNEPGVEIRGLKGTLDPFDIQQGIEPHQDALSACYNDKVGRRRYLGGDIVLKFTIAKSGEVKRVSTNKSDLGAWDVEKCMLDVSRSMKFSPPRGGEADFTLPLEFSATRSVAWLEDAVAGAQVKEHKVGLRECARSQRTRNPKAVKVTLYVGPRGAVQSVGFSSAEKRPLSEAWADCAETTIRAWILADPMGRVAKMTFRYN